MVLATAPRLVLLDEPAAGMTEDGKGADRRPHRTDAPRPCVAVLLIEHDMAFVEALDCPVSVMVMGRIVASGSFAEVRRDPLVRQAYLGAPPHGVTLAATEPERLDDRRRVAGYGQGVVLDGLSLTRRSRRGARTDRAQRRRQDDAAARRSWASSGCAPAAMRYGGSAHRPAQPVRDRAPRHRLCAAGARDLPTT